MIGLDTNVLLRMFERDDLAQSRPRASALVRSRREWLLCNPIVLTELTWTLRAHL